MTQAKLINALLNARSQIDYTTLDLYLVDNPDDITPVVAEVLETYELYRDIVINPSIEKINVDNK